MNMTYFNVNSQIQVIFSTGRSSEKLHNVSEIPEDVSNYQTLDFPDAELAGDATLSEPFSCGAKEIEALQHASLIARFNMILTLAVLPTDFISPVMNN